MKQEQVLNERLVREFEEFNNQLELQKFNDYKKRLGNLEKGLQERFREVSELSLNHRNNLYEEISKIKSNINKLESAFDY
jgi:hypothetical protein